MTIDLLLVSFRLREAEPGSSDAAPFSPLRRGRLRALLGDVQAKVSDVLTWVRRGWSAGPI